MTTSEQPGDAQPGDAQQVSANSSAEQRPPSETDFGLPKTAPSPLFQIRGEIPRWISVSTGITCLLLCTLAWWWVTRGPGEERILGHSQLPSIRETYDLLPEVFDKSSPGGHILENTLVSLRRVLIGFGLAVAVGVPIGVAAGCFPWLRAFFAPVVLFGRNTPIAALIPLVMALFGTGESQKFMFIFIACVAFIVSDTIDAISDVAQRYIETALTLGASTMQIVFKVLVPLAMPTVCNSLRVLFGLAFGYIMLVESVRDDEGPGGLGLLLNVARRMGITEYTMIIILTIPLVALLIDQVLYVIQCNVFWWKYADEAKRSATFRLSRWVMQLFWRSHR